MSTSANRWLLWLGWWAVWALITLPWGNVEPDPQWQRVRWIPFEGLGRRGALDAALNLAFFVPFGYLLARSGRRLGAVVAAAAAVSLLTEVVQIYAHSRYPSATDILTNAAGGAIGAALVILPFRRRVPAR